MKISAELLEDLLRRRPAPAIHLWASRARCSRSVESSLISPLSRKKPNGADKRDAQELVNDFVRALLRDGDQEVAAIERAARDGGLLEQARPISQDRRFRKARQLDRYRPPKYVNHSRWTGFMDDCEQFLNSRWALIAASLGSWNAPSLFGMNPANPLLKVAELGLLWHIQGGAIVELSAGDALIERAGSRRPHTRRPFHPATRVPWDLERRRPVSPAGEQSQQRHWVRA